MRAARTATALLCTVALAAGVAGCGGSELDYQEVPGPPVGSRSRASRSSTASASGDASADPDADRHGRAGRHHRPERPVGLHRRLEDTTDTGDDVAATARPAPTAAARPRPRTRTPRPTTPPRRPVPTHSSSRTSAPRTPAPAERPQSAQFGRLAASSAPSAAADKRRDTLMRGRLRRSRLDSRSPHAGLPARPLPAASRRACGARARIGGRGGRRRRPLRADERAPRRPRGGTRY